MLFTTSLNWLQNFIKLESIICIQLDKFTTYHNLQFEDEAGLLIVENVQVLNFNAVKSVNR